MSATDKRHPALVRQRFALDFRLAKGLGEIPHANAALAKR